MRVNKPVTGREYVLRDGETIVSKTDLKGNITYINADFVRISGFDTTELLGAPQNIVRHPDMPPAAFADMWRSLRAGRPWTGLVKNRCKNGDHYWVEAHAAPLLENGAVTGYTSIRIKPARAAVEAAEQAYAAIRAGRTELVIHDGQVRQRTGRWRSAAAGIGLRTQACSAGLVGAAGMFAAGWLGAGQHFAGAALSGILALAGTALVSLSSLRAHGRQLASMSTAIKTMSAGDLGASIPSCRGEVAPLADAVRVLQTNVKLLVGQIMEAATAVREDTASMAARNLELSRRTEAQARLVERTSASMVEIGATTRDNAAAADAVRRLMSDTTTMADAGADAAHAVADTMETIRGSAIRVGEIVGLIDDIAFQTNILALNASIEAARAGAHGRGFAVVANEVRALAQRASVAAREIRSLVDRSAEGVEQGVDLVEQARATMGQISARVREVDGLMSAIANASAEQSTGVGEIGEALSRIDAITQQNAQQVDTAAEHAARMRIEAQELSRLVNSFRLTSSQALGRKPLAGQAVPAGARLGAG